VLWKERSKGLSALTNEQRALFSEVDPNVEKLAKMPVD
jgi:hypothetical protein